MGNYALLWRLSCSDSFSNSRPGSYWLKASLQCHFTEVIIWQRKAESPGSCRSSQLSWVGFALLQGIKELLMKRDIFGGSLWGAHTPLCRFRGGGEGEQEGFFLHSKQNFRKWGGWWEGREGGGKQASTYYIPTVSTVTFHNHNSGGKMLHCKAGGGRMALWMQPARDGSPSTCGSPSEGLGSKGQLSSWECSTNPGPGIQMHSAHHHPHPFISRMNIYK